MKISEDVKIAATFVTCMAYVGAFLYYMNYNADNVCTLGSQHLWSNGTD